MNEITLLLLSQVGTFVGWGVGYVMGRRKVPTPPRAVCGCKHAMSMHDPETNQCHDIVMLPSKYDSIGSVVAKKPQSCPCRQYTGPRPLETYYSIPMLPPKET